MPLDLTKEHTIHGAGAGKDVIVQFQGDEIKLYDRTGTELPLDPKVLVSKGLALTDALKIQVEEARAHIAARKLEQRLKLIGQRAQEKAMAQAETGDLPDWSEDVEEDYADLLSDLEE